MMRAASQDQGQGGVTHNHNAAPINAVDQQRLAPMFRRNKNMVFDAITAAARNGRSFR